MADELADRKITFSRDVRLGDLLTVIGVLLAGSFAWSKTDARVSRLEEIAVRQETTNGRLEASIKENVTDLRGDIKEVSQTVRRIESRRQGRDG
jgi:HAMP domain-containing protein